MLLHLMLAQNVSVTPGGYVTRQLKRLLSCLTDFSVATWLGWHSVRSTQASLETQMIRVSHPLVYRVTKPDDLSLVLGTYVLGGEN